jgi:hypothetical protein
LFDNLLAEKLAASGALGVLDTGARPGPVAL